MSRQGTPVGLFKNGKLVDLFPSTAAAARHIGSNRIALHKAMKAKSLFKGCYEVKRHVEGNLFEEHLENVFKEYDIPASTQATLDTEGLINLFTALNATCYCEEHPGFRKKIAGLVIKRYRHARAQGSDRKLSVAYAYAVAGYECTHKTRPLNRWWKTFFDYQEASRILHKGPTLKRKIKVEPSRSIRYNGNHDSFYRT